ncbi:MAG: RagB/SusD family nutrient uptake outer membrane protein [Ferruginibacter sp.]|nr:RagB/SusD family nutrient uptake outer membrane protein [Ferruginibacter sp.]
MSSKYIINGLAGIVLCLCFSSCEKFLDERPSKGSSVVVTTTSDLNALLNGYATFFRESNNVAIYGSDDNGVSTAIYNARPSFFTSSIVQFSLWDVPNLPITDQGNTAFWSSEYTKIFNANLVLANLDAVKGTEAEKAALSADAHLIRAYSYWELANTYCLPYSEATKGEPGLPLKILTDYEPVGRGTLEATYQQIEADLTAALATTVPLVQNGVAKHWRANIAAANGFAARFYLHKSDYTKALQYANAALAHYSFIVDYNTGMRNGTPVVVTVGGAPTTVQVPYTYDKPVNVDPTDALGWKEFLYYRILNNSSLWYIPSQQLLNLYDQANDLRYKYHIVQNYSYLRSFTNPAFSYPGYVFFNTDGIPEGPTTAEMVLIKAECLARTGDVSGAMTAINQLYVKRTKTGTAPLAATTQDQAITVVLNERRRELPFSQRWFDIRRFNTNSYAGDDVSLSRVFYPYTANAVQNTQPVQTYTLPKGSRRFASPLPQTDVDFSNGQIPQNTY